MLKFHTIHQSAYVCQPWKNGQGSTFEISRNREESLLWRISVADLKGKQPGSVFPGCTRLFTILGDEAVEIEGIRKNTVVSVKRGDVISFSGDLSPVFQVKKATQDFNVIFDKKKIRATAYSQTVLKSEQIQLPINGKEHFLFVAEGACSVRSRTDESHWEIATKDTFQISRESDKEHLSPNLFGMSEKNQIIWVTIHYL